MTYRLYYTDADCSKAQYMGDKSRQMPLAYNELASNLTAASRLLGAGGIPWEIARDDGSVIDRDTIKELLQSRPPN